jgi:hypothetical protein
MSNSVTQLDRPLPQTALLPAGSITPMTDIIQNQYANPNVPTTIQPKKRTFR